MFGLNHPKLEGAAALLCTCRWVYPWYPELLLMLAFGPQEGYDTPELLSEAIVNEVLHDCCLIL